MFACYKTSSGGIAFIFGCATSLWLVLTTSARGQDQPSPYSKNHRSSGEDGVYFRFRDGTVRLETTAFRNESGLSLTALDPEEFISNWAFEASPNEFLRSHRRQVIVFCTATISTHTFIQGGYRTNLQAPEIQWNRGIRHSVCIHESIHLPLSMT